MFTGIITGVGQIIDSTPLGDLPGHGRRLTVQAPPGYLDDVGLGDSIAINGACMTVTSFDLAAHQFTIDISAESLDKTCGLDKLGSPRLAGLDREVVHQQRRRDGREVLRRLDRQARRRPRAPRLRGQPSLPCSSNLAVRAGGSSGLAIEWIRHAAAWNRF